MFYLLNLTVAEAVESTECLSAEFITRKLSQGILNTPSNDVKSISATIQSIYDNKIDMNTLKDIELEQSSHVKLFVDIFTVAVVSDRVNHFCNFVFNSTDISFKIKSLIFASMLHEMDDHLYFYKAFRKSFDINFINIQLEMLQLINTSKIIQKRIRVEDLFFLNKDISGLKDLYNIYTSPNFPANSDYGSPYSFAHFLNFHNIFNRPNIYKYFLFSKEEVEFINSMSIDIDILNKIVIDNIENLFLLDRKYSIADIYLKEETIEKIDSETLNKYLERFVADLSSTVWTVNKTAIERLLQFIPLESVTHEIIKKYYKLFFQHCNFTFQQRILEKKYNLKSMLILLEECV